MRNWPRRHTKALSTILVAGHHWLASLWKSVITFSFFYNNLGPIPWWARYWALPGVFKGTDRHLRLMKTEVAFPLPRRSLGLVVPKEAGFSLCLRLFSFIPLKTPRWQVAQGVGGGFCLLGRIKLALRHVLWMLGRVLPGLSRSNLPWNEKSNPIRNALQDRMSNTISKT